MREPPRLVIFDCDGVLVDSEPISNRVWCEHLRAIGWTHTDKQSHEMFVGRSMRDCVAIVEDRLCRSVPDGFVARFREASFEAFRRDLKPIGGVAGLIDGLVECGIRVCVASSGPHEKIRLNLTITGLLDRFDEHIFSAMDVARGKPWPDLFLHASRSLGVAPAGCLVIEDSVPGVQAAVGAGMRVLGYAPAADATALATAGATTFSDMRDVLRMILPSITTPKKKPRQGGACESQQ